jgi:hypothetical protein
MFVLCPDHHNIAVRDAEGDQSEPATEESTCPPLRDKISGFTSVSSKSSQLEIYPSPRSDGTLSLAAVSPSLPCFIAES